MYLYMCVNDKHVVFSRLFRNLTKEVRLYAQKFIDKGRVSHRISFGRKRNFVWCRSKLFLIKYDNMKCRIISPN